VGIKREMRFWVVLPHVFGIEETPKPRDLRREMDHDDLHLDIELQSQELVDHLAELCAPCEDAQLGSREQKVVSTKEGGMEV